LVARVVLPEPPFGLITSVVFVLIPSAAYARVSRRAVNYCSSMRRIAMNAMLENDFPIKSP
jgi:hypothetical protein